MACPNCSGETRETDRYCPYCGQRLPQKLMEADPEPKPATDWATFAFTLLGSLALTLLLSWLLHFPVFILAGVLPLLWRRKRQ